MPIAPLEGRSCLLAAAPLAVVARRPRQLRGVIYARFSSRFQKSIEDQVRECRSWAEANDVEVLDSDVYTDSGQSGRKLRRKGLQAMLDRLQRDDVDVVIVFSTNRLHRKLHRALQFVDESIVERRRRCVFVAQRIDTADERFWRALIYVFAMMDEMHVTMGVAHVQAAHQGLLLKGRVHNTLAYGYVGVAVAGEVTRLNKPATTIAVCEKARIWVEQIFQWFVRDRLGYSTIAKRLRKDGAPAPARAKRWNSRIVRALLANRRYVGDWSYGRMQSIWQSKADYSRRVPRSEPLLEYVDERLRIIDDVSFNAAQDRIESMKLGSHGGRFRADHNGQTVVDPLRELFFCPEHGALRPYGSSAGDLACNECKKLDAELQTTYSVINRQTAIRRLCEAIAGLLRRDTDLAERIVDHAMSQLKESSDQAMQAARLAELQKEVDSISDQIRFIMDAPGTTKEDRDENRAKLVELRGRRAPLAAEITRLKSEMLRPANPDLSVEQVREKLKDMLGVMTLGVTLAIRQEQPDHDAAIRLREVFHLVTGGRVVVRQCGEKRNKGGWLEAEFVPQLVSSTCGVPATTPAVGDPPLRISFERPRSAELDAPRVMPMWNAGVGVLDIATQLRMNRNAVTRAVDWWHRSQGLPRPNYYARRNRKVWESRRQKSS